METASQYQQIMADNPNNPFAGDDRLWVRFEMVPVEDPEKSAQEGPHHLRGHPSRRNPHAQETGTTSSIGP